MVSERMLVVDEADAIRVVLRVYFEALGFAVDCARGLAQARELLERHAYDVVISDMCLEGPLGREGFEVAERVRELSPGTRTLMLTAFGSADVEREAQEHGVDLLLCKPQPLPDLAHHVADLLRSAPPLAA